MWCCLCDPTFSHVTDGHRAMASTAVKIRNRDVSFFPKLGQVPFLNFLPSFSIHLFPSILSLSVHSLPFLTSLIYIMNYLCCLIEQGADLHVAQLVPLLLTVSCFSKVQIVLIFLVPAYPGSPGIGAVKCVLLVLSWQHQ